jgi:hypothetical protein
MQWEVILAIILAIGVGIALKEAFEKRSSHKRKNKRILPDQHSSNDSIER